MQQFAGSDQIAAVSSPGKDEYRKHLVRGPLSSVKKDEGGCCAVTVQQLESTRSVATTACLSSTRSFTFGTEPELVKKLDINDFKVGEVLGTGSFCIVSKIESWFKPLPANCLLKHSSGNSSPEGQDNEGWILDKKSRRSIRNGRDTHSFALKRVRPGLRTKHPEIFTQGLKDLAYEAELLTAMVDHPNIISLYGVSRLGASHFIVVEQLQKTLSQRLTEWARVERQNNRSFLRPSRKKLIRSYESRIEAALSLASVLEYLHENDIVYRDLKPENAGFDVNGNLKLFDFGMAKRLVAADLAEDGVHYNLTSMTGTLRYMAPEVGLGQAYNSSADVYSWALVLWYLLKLQVPFGWNCTYSTIVVDVIGKGKRPIICDTWSKPLAYLLERAWDAKPTARPTATELCSVLEYELVECVATIYSLKPKK